MQTSPGAALGAAVNLPFLGEPRTQETAANEGIVRLLLPRGTYTFTPSINVVPADGAVTKMNLASHQRDSASTKEVLPAQTGRDYEGLAIHVGGMASREFHSWLPCTVPRFQREAGSGSRGFSAGGGSGLVSTGGALVASFVGVKSFNSSLPSDSELIRSNHPLP